MTVNLATVYCEFVKRNDLKALLGNASLPNDETSVLYEVLIWLKEMLLLCEDDELIDSHIKLKINNKNVIISATSKEMKLCITE